MKHTRITGRHSYNFYCPHCLKGFKLKSDLALHVMACKMNTEIRGPRAKRKA